MSEQTAKHPALRFVLAAVALTLLLAAASSLVKKANGNSPRTRQDAAPARSETLRPAPCGSTTEGGPEGPPMQADDACTTYSKITGPVTEPAVQDPDRYAWRTFCELNQPARGDGRERVWQTWANQLDLFVSKPDPNDPPTWARATASSRRPLFQKRAELMAALASHQSSGDSSSSSSGSGSSSTKSTNLPKPRYDAESCDPNTTQQVFLNRPQFEYVVSNHLWYVEGQVAAYATQKPIEFPTDATTVKAMWRPIEPADKPKYFWTESNGKLYGLASFLVMSKTIPTWTWASAR
jgi:hypothetical protein